VPAGAATYTLTPSPSGPGLVYENASDIARRLIELRVEHRDLDEVIDRLSLDPRTDEVQIKRLKKRKLRIKDMISYLENKLIPDLDA